MAKKKRIEKKKDKKTRVWEKTDGHCHLCGEKLVDPEWQIDHLVPKLRGGADELWNLLPICGFCNRMKKAATLLRMRRLLMYGRYCVDAATRREDRQDGQTIYEVVGRRAKATHKKSGGKSPHLHLWKRTPKKG